MPHETVTCVGAQFVMFQKSQVFTNPKVIEDDFIEDIITFCDACGNALPSRSVKQNIFNTITYKGRYIYAVGLQSNSKPIEVA